jgi:hypothetical protein
VMSRVITSSLSSASFFSPFAFFFFAFLSREPRLLWPLGLGLAVGLGL